MIKLMLLLKEKIERDPKKWREVNAWTTRKIISKGWHPCKKHDWVPYQDNQLHLRIDA